MRLPSLALSAFSLVCMLTPMAAHAQYGGGPGGSPGGDPNGGGGSSQDDAKKKRLDREMQTQALPLPVETADGPCPYVKVLYDAARTIDFKDNKQASANVKWSGEMQGLVADCAYKNADPIKVRTNITFLFGRGPQAEGEKTSFTYWVAVTDRNKAILDKQYFNIPVQFPVGADRVISVERVADIQIPRATAAVKGDNFEILVGFDVTPDQAAFNRSGSRFLPDAYGQTQTAATPTAGGKPGTPTAQ